MNIFQQIESGLDRALTLPSDERAKITSFLTANPAVATEVNDVKDKLITTIVKGATQHISDPTAQLLAAVAITSTLERAIPTPPTPATTAPAVAVAPTPPAPLESAHP